MAGLPDFLRHPFGKSAEREANVPPVIEIGGQQIPITIRRLAQSRRMVMRLAPMAARSHLHAALGPHRRSFGLRPEPCGLAGNATGAPCSARAAGRWLHPALSRRAAAVDHVVSAPRRPAVIESTLRLGGPAEGLDTRIRRWLQAEAKALFAQDLAFYCARAKVAIHPGADQCAVALGQLLGQGNHPAQLATHHGARCRAAQRGRP
jgi:hypothetical protein